jgi:hypothetical protein
VRLTEQRAAPPTAPTASDQEQTRGGGSDGYKLHLAACTRTVLPLAWQVETAQRNESLYVTSLLDASRERGFSRRDVRDGRDTRAWCRADHLPW